MMNNKQSNWLQSWDLVKRGGFLLTKWISNNPQVIASVPVEERAKEIKGLDLNHDPMPVYLLKKWLWQFANTKRQLLMFGLSKTVSLLH